MTRKPFRAALLLAASLLLPLCAHAQAFRTYLASYGNDANPCTVGSPCRLLPTALNAVLDGGEVWILDSANYNSGNVNIAKSVSILAVPGQTASIVAVASAPAITISTSSVRVALRNIVIAKNANNPGTNGIVMTSGSMLSIEDCIFANLSGAALYVHDMTGSVHVKNTVFRNLSNYAIWAENGPTVNVVNSQMLNTGGTIAFGTAAASTTTLNLTDSVISTAGEGAYATTTVAGAVARIFVTRSTLHNVSYALDAEVIGGGTATVYVANSAVDGSPVAAWYVGGVGASVVTYGNNQFSGNAGSQGSMTFNSLQ